MQTAELLALVLGHAERPFAVLGQPWRRGGIGDLHDLKPLASRKTDLGFLARKGADHAQSAQVFGEFLYRHLRILGITASVELLNPDLAAIDAARRIDFSHRDVHGNLGAHGHARVAPRLGMGESQNQVLGPGGSHQAGRQAGNNEQSFFHHALH